MADQNVFGMTPEDLQAARMAALNQQSLQFAQLSPMQQAQMGMFRAGNQFAQAAGGPDPQLARIQQRQSLLQGVNIADPNSLRSAAQQALQNGDYVGAQTLAQRAMDIEKAGVDVREKESIIAKNTADKTTPEQKNAAALADGEAQRGTPEWAKAYASHLNDLTTAAGKVIPWKEIGVATDGTKRPVYVDQNTGTQFVFGPAGPDGKMQKIPYVDGVDRSTAKVSATANAKGPETLQEDEFSKELGKKNADRMDAAMQQAQTSAAALRNIQEMQKKNAGGIYTGPQAQGTMVATNFLQSIGLLSSDNAKKLSDSTAYDKLAKDLVLKDLGGKLGNQISDADRQFIEARIPQLTTSPQARTELLNWLQAQHSRNVDYYRRMQVHANKNHTLNDFDFADAPTAPLGTATNPIKLK